MNVVGLTGGVGSGKSTVAAMLRKEGVTVLDADQAAREVVEPGTEGLAEIASQFGPDLLQQGALDRARMAELVFSDAGARRRLEAIIHPRVRAWMAEQTFAADLRGESVVVQEIPLLYESGLESLMRWVIVVWIPAELQVRRLVEGQGWTTEHARARIQAQLPIDIKRERADFVIDNSGSRESTQDQLSEIWRKVTDQVQNG